MILSQLFYLCPMVLQEFHYPRGVIEIKKMVFFSDALNAFDGGVRQTIGVNATAGIWVSYPQSFLSTGNGFSDQVMLKKYCYVGLVKTTSIIMGVIWV